MPHREHVSYFFRGCAPRRLGTCPEIKKRASRWGTERGPHAGSPLGVLVHHLRSGGKADRLGSGCGLARSVLSASPWLTAPAG